MASAYRLGRAMLALTAAGYVAFDAYAAIFNPLPLFIMVENLVYAAVLGAAALLYDRGWQVRAAAALVAAFSAGRVSRSVVTPVGTLGELALQHLPLLAWLIALSIVLAAAAWGPGGDKRSHPHR